MVFKRLFMKSKIVTVSFPLVVYQEKSIFGGIFRKPQKPTQEDSSDREVKMRTLVGKTVLRIYCD